MGIYLRVLAVLYAAGAVFHFLNLFGAGLVSLEEMTIPLRVSEAVYAQLATVTVFGLWIRRPWGLICFFIFAFSQIILYWGFSGLFALSDRHFQALQGMINIHISTLAIFVMIRMKER